MMSDYTMCVGGVLTQCVYGKWLHNVCMVTERERDKERDRVMGDYTMCVWRVCVCERDMVSDCTLCVGGVLTQCKQLWIMRDYTMCVWGVVAQCVFDACVCVWERDEEWLYDVCMRSGCTMCVCEVVIQCVHDMCVCERERHDESLHNVCMGSECTLCLYGVIMMRERVCERERDGWLHNVFMKSVYVREGYDKWLHTVCMRSAHTM